ncbi:DMP19 family protein [Polyangium aurulentum]|uniref:DMP19 family protein n=1 Tax=Polyangium aurulentum TaxID=2567896 RepID=UPI0010ADD88F|nr:DUF4375 domain-containing protein [Polyangium aurulentum]UQA55550.1 DMP19 family protein [Polyangium aurulentum]
MELFRYSGQTTDELLALEHEVSVFWLCFAFENAVEQKFERAVGQKPWEDPGFEIYLAQFFDMAAGRPMKGPLTEEELTVLAIMTLDRQVVNGGYDQMFVNSMAFTPILVQACERIGRPDVAAVTQRALDTLGYDPRKLGGRPHLEELGRWIREQDGKLYDECDGRFYDIAEDLVEVSLWSFIKANRDKITVP